MAYTTTTILVAICCPASWERLGVWSDLLLQIHSAVTLGDLTTGKPGLKYREIPAKTSLRLLFIWRPSGFMTSKSTPPQNRDMKQTCKHPRVQIVSRDEDCEFVECKECGEIFESSEFKDMNIEERAQESEI
jgi:hypothetical protein